ncbi:EAL and HDOD domain-containing protein [Glaciecola sp. 1036]|uniref:EAL and HDOD domain-containing protein n=1 Tax=Alteromonadaceae TaxID=72275 RepID=UPI003D07D695
MAFYAARQPILDINKELVGYELLFRTSLENIFPQVDEEKATSKMLEGLYLDMGLDKIAEGKKAFINFSKQTLLNGFATLLPKDKIAIEILESVQPTQAVFFHMRELHQMGYTIALDDFIHGELWEPFYPYCNIIKVDCLSITDTDLMMTVEVAKRHPHIQLLAEKVETVEIYKKYKAIGFTMFQGYFFAKPEVIKSVSLSTPQAVVSKLLAEVTKPEPDIEKITRTFESDAALSFKLLRYTQSPLFKRQRKVESIKQAIVMLGKRELERFIMLLFAAVFCEAKPNELIKLSLKRAKFCEDLAGQLSQSSSTAFLAGMLSLLDAMLDTNLPSVISKLPLTDEIKLALVREEGILAEYLKLNADIEMANWDNLKLKAKHLNLDIPTILKIHSEAADWADRQTSIFN